MGVTRETLRHTLIYSGATLLGRLTSFLLLPVYAYTFKTEGYGVLGILDASLGLLTISFAAGFHNAIVKFYHEETPERRHLVVPTALWLTWGLSGAVVAIPMVASPAISGFLLGDRSYSAHVSLALLTFVLDIGAQSASTFLVIQRRSTFYSLVGFVRLFVSLFLNIWLVVILGIGLIGFFIASLVTSAVALAFFMYPLIRESGLPFDATLGREIIKFQLPLVPGDFVAYASRQAERFFARFLLGLGSVGVLEMGYKFPPLLNLIAVQPFLRAWQTKYYEIAPTSEAPKTLGSMFTRFFFILVFFALLLAVNVENLIVVMTPPEFWASSKIAKIEILTTVLAGISSYMVLGILYRKKTGRLGTIRFVAAPAKIALSFLFISLLGIGGAAYSALAVEVGLALCIGWSAQRVYPIQLEYRKLGMTAVGGFALARVVDSLNYGDYAFTASVERVLVDSVDILVTLLPRGAFLDLISRLFHSGQGQVVASLFNTLLAMTFLALLPWISPEVREVVASRLWARRSPTTS